MRDGIQRLLTDLELARLSRLSINSRFTVEGSLKGAHASPQKGFSVEFADYRQYTPGDDLRHLDWRVFARNEKPFIRQYEEECNLRLYLALDHTGSMAYDHQGISKWQAACRIAASLAYVTIHQHDSVGLGLFGEQGFSFLPARSGLHHLRLVANQLAELKPAGEQDLASRLHELAARIPRRSLIAILSDCFTDHEALKGALAHLRRRRHDVIVIQILDPAEITFPFRDLGHFEDLETAGSVITNPREIREAYLEEMEHFLNGIRTLAASLNIDYRLYTTDQDIGLLVQHHLNWRYRQGL